MHDHSTHRHGMLDANWYCDSPRGIFGVFLFAFLLSSQSPSWAGEVIHVCGEEFAPYSYSEVNSDGQLTGRIVGASIDLLSEVSKETQLEFEVSLIPWKRCERETRYYGERGRFEMMLDATSNEERLENFTPTSVLYTNHQGLYFSKKRFPEGNKNPSLATIRNKIFCGILGHNYSYIEQMDIGAKIDYISPTLESAMFMLYYERCDFFAYSPVLIQGAVLTRQLQLPQHVTDGIDHVPFPNMTENRFRFWVSNGSDRNREIVQKINSVVEKLKGDRYEQIFRRYLVGGSGLPVQR